MKLTKNNTLALNAVADILENMIVSAQESDFLNTNEKECFLAQNGEILKEIKSLAQKGMLENNLNRADVKDKYQIFTELALVF